MQHSSDIGLGTSMLLCLAFFYALAGFAYLIAMVRRELWVMLLAPFVIVGWPVVFVWLQWVSSRNSEYDD